MALLSNQKIGSLCKINHIDLSQSKKIKLLGLGIKAGLTVSILRNRGGILSSTTL
jgi:Fe2+ transport system protein FeoA